MLAGVLQHLQQWTTAWDLITCDVLYSIRVYSPQGIYALVPACCCCQCIIPRADCMCRWRKELTWRCFLVSAITIVVVRYSTTVCLSHGHCTNLGWGSLAWFQQAYPTPYGQVRNKCYESFVGWLQSQALSYFLHMFSCTVLQLG